MAFLLYAIAKLWITTARLRERVDAIDGGLPGDLDDFEWLKQLAKRDRD
jgi:hypothetical protein